MSFGNDLQPSRPPVDQVEDDLVAMSGEAFIEDGKCLFCGCEANGERPDGRGELVHDSVIFHRPDGSWVQVALQCVACKPGQAAVCWKHPGWDEVSGELREKEMSVVAPKSPGLPKPVAPNNLQ